MDLLIYDDAHPALVLVEDESVDANLFVPLERSVQETVDQDESERTHRNADFLNEIWKA